MADVHPAPASGKPISLSSVFSAFPEQIFPAFVRRPALTGQVLDCERERDWKGGA